MKDGPEVVLIALAFRRNHPEVSSLDILEACFRHQAGGNISALGDALQPGSEFAQMVCEAFGCSEVGVGVQRLAERFKLITH